jgi:xanthine dehydrogenase YagR molybdenum-binding subunit
VADTPVRPWTDTKVVGTAQPRIDGHERVTGSAVYARDMVLPEMLHAAFARCPHAHAMVKKVDVSKALQMPGVRAVLTGDSPGAKLPFYFTPRGPLSWLFDPHCRHEGEEVAAVAAESLAEARAAAKAIEVEYEELPFNVDYEKALDAKAPVLHEGGNSAGVEKYARGDVAKGFAEADAVVEMTFRTPCEIHVPMETHGSVVKWEGDRLIIHDTNQGVFDLRSAYAQYFQLPLGNVRVESAYMGGGFGSKLEPGKYALAAALLSRQTGRPVKLFLSREESFLCVGNRPPNTLRMKAGAKKDGTLTALQLTGIGTGGAYPEGSDAGYLTSDLYLCPNVAIEEANVYVNAGKARAFRAPGFPQGAWALEQVMDALARKLGLDPLALRLKNVPKVSQRRGNLPYTSTGLAQCLQDGAKAFGWEEARRRPRGTGPLVRGVGVAAGMWGWDGDPRGTAVLRYVADGSASLTTGASDIGTGTKTWMAMIVAEELGVPLASIHVDNADTDTTPYAVLSGGSQTVHVNSPAVRAAALDVKRQLLEMAAEQLSTDAASLELNDGVITDRATPDRKVALKDLKGLQEQQTIVGIGRRKPHKKGMVGLPFVAHFAEVEVDTRTGETRVVRLLGAHDSGRPMNLLTYRNQVFGGMTMGIGFAMTEERVLDRNTGRMPNANWHDYKIATAKDVPADLTCLPIDPHDTEFNDTGTKGIGEPATIPTAAAIANAVFHATGVRVTDTPVNPMQMARLLAARKAGR